MKAGWLSKNFGVQAGVAGALLATTAAAATVYAVLPYHVDEIVAQAPDVKPAYKPKHVPKKVAPPEPAGASLFIHIAPNPVSGYEIYTDGFCKEFADQCGGQGPASAIMFTPNTLALLGAVNEGVNKAVEYKSDQELFGVTGRFSLPVSRDGGKLQGDCEDHALLKRQILSDRGVPRETMMLGLVRVNQSGNEHAILIVRTTGGDYALDNRHNEIKRVKDLIDSKEYTFLFMSRPENDMVLSAVVAADDRNDTANLNRNGVWPAAVRGNVPTADEVYLALAPKPITTPTEDKIMVAQALPAATPTATP